MNVKSWLGVLMILIPLGGGAAAETVADLPLHIQRLDPRAVRVWIGEEISSTATVGIATDKGILVIDTTGNPKIDRELRRIIARELGRDDFAMLINTHEHLDHTGGNVVYADCTIVGHELVGAGMAAAAENRRQATEWRTTRIAELEREIAGAPAGSATLGRLREELAVVRLNLEADSSEPGLYPPTRTFKDRLILDLGDATAELYYIGGMHSASDIAVLVPHLGLLMTGDTMADVWLTDTPGCLASFMARPGVRHDFPLLLETWELLLARKDAVKTLLTGHWNGELTFPGFEARVDYVKTLWEGVNRGVEEGKTLAELQTEYRLDARFPHLVDSPGFTPRNNYMTLLEIWGTVTHQESAADRLYALIDEGGDQDAVRRILAEHDAQPAKYYFLEDQINAYGYRFLQEDKTLQAVALFRANAELFPGSWNVYDSLGEALLKAGDTDAAARMYEKSLELNPDSPSGKAALAGIRAAGS